MVKETQRCKNVTPNSSCLVPSPVFILECGYNMYNLIPSSECQGLDSWSLAWWVERSGHRTGTISLS